MDHTSAGQFLYPTFSATNSYGNCLLASKELKPGTIVEKFDGPLVDYDNVPEKDRSYVILIDKNSWLNPKTSARYINHSCNPNSFVDDDLHVITKKEIKKGEEITIDYNSVSLSDFLAAPESFFWDRKWSFICYCGSENCRKVVDGYNILASETQYLHGKIAVADAGKKGSGVFAISDFKKGDVIEKCPVIFSDGKEWNNLKETVLFNYVFTWRNEHSGIALGFGSLYNHSYTPNACYNKNENSGYLEFFALRDIFCGEEILINYNGNPESQEPLWFHSI